MRIGAQVYDTWWPDRIGKIVKMTPGRRWTKVQWSDGEAWNYDRSHTQFLREYVRGRKREKRKGLL